MMRYLKNRSFQRDMKDYHLDDQYVKGILDDIFAGRSVPLGSKLYKIRSAGEGRGKSGGFRNIFFWKRDELIVFCLIFGKNEQGNLSTDEKKALKILSDTYDQLNDGEIKGLINKNKFKEIDYDKEK